MLLFVYALLVMGWWPETINHLYCIVLIALIIVKRRTYMSVEEERFYYLFSVTPKLYHVFRVGQILVVGDQID